MSSCGKAANASVEAIGVCERRRNKYATTDAFAVSGSTRHRLPSTPLRPCGARTAVDSWSDAALRAVQDAADAHAYRLQQAERLIAEALGGRP